ncbi:MAG: GGDEF domain-containing protein [Clostridia bacterium]|nr:GGDEF domain-containing protein [Clostridia bacterium]
MKMYAMMLSTSDDMFAEELWTHLSDVVETSDNRLFFFCGKPLESSVGDEHYSNVIFNLMQNFPMDGLIVSSNSLSKYIGINALETFIQRYGQVPVVSMNIPLGKHKYVLLNDKNSSYRLMRHLLDQHNFKKIGYITGQLDNDVVEARFEGFLNAITEVRGRPIDYIVKHGDFSKASGYVLGKELIEEGVDLIVCGHDIIAVGIYDLAKTMGISIPGDLKIVGFGDIEEAKLLEPPLTTVNQSFSELAELALDVLVNNKESSIFEPEVIVRGSCGCKMGSRGESILEIKENYRRAIDSYRDSMSLSVAFNHIDSLSELNETLKQYFYEINGKEFYLCLFNEGSLVIDDPFNFDYPKMMHMVFGYNNGTIHEHIQYEAREGLPDEIYFKTKASAFLVYPININNRCYGHLFTDATTAKNLSFVALRTIITNTLNRIYSYNQLKTYNTQLKDLAFRDSLTGVYNRRGFFDVLYKDFNKNINTVNQPVLLYADVNRLKEVNDTFGHATGDDLIIAAANLLKKYFPHGVISRVGGDEFVVYIRAIAKDTLEKILDEFNNESIRYLLNDKKGIQVSLCIGYCYYNPDAHHGLSEWIDEADQNMYKIKNKRYKLK